MGKQMNTYIALLRAVNVGGRGIIKMSELKAIFESLGFSDVTTYIQTGNVIFTTRENDRPGVARQIESALASVANYPIDTFILSVDELREAERNNPFDPATDETERYCYLMFLSAEPSEARCRELVAVAGDDYRISCHGRLVYYSYSRALAGRRRPINFEKILGVRGTARSWKVVHKLIELASQSDN